LNSGAFLLAIEGCGQTFYLLKMNFLPGFPGLPTGNPVGRWRNHRACESKSKRNIVSSYSKTKALGCGPPETQVQERTISRLIRATRDLSQRHISASIPWACHDQQR
jgi:hypothetical protein